MREVLFVMSQDLKDAILSWGFLHLKWWNEHLANSKPRWNNASNPVNISEVEISAEGDGVVA